MWLKRPSIRRFDPPTRYYDPMKDPDRFTRRKIKFNSLRSGGNPPSLLRNVLIFIGAVWLLFYILGRS